MPTVGIYCRISRDREGQDLGVQRQEEDCRTLAARLGWPVHDVYSDNDMSASSRSRQPRPRYRQLLEDVDDGVIDAIVAYSPSRLTRRPLEFEGLVSRADKGLRIATVAAGDMDLATANGRMIARILAAADAREAEENSERSRRERQQRREQGRWNGGHRPFGFEPDGTTPRPSEQEVIRRAAGDLLQGRPIAAIARDWSRALPCTPSGAEQFSARTVHDVLINPRLIARLPSGHAAVWEPVLDEATWRGVVALLGDPSRRSGGRGPSRFLTGIAVCGRCAEQGEESFLHGSVDRRHRPGYRCRGHRHLERLAGPVDEYVARYLTAYLAGQRLRAAAREDTAPLAVQAQALRARLSEFLDMLAAHELDRGEYVRATGRVRAELEDVEARMVAAASASRLAGLPASVEELRASWDGFDVDRRRGLLKASGLRVVVHPAGQGKHKFDPATVQITPPGISAVSSGG